VEQAVCEWDEEVRDDDASSHRLTPSTGECNLIHTHTSTHRHTD